MPAESVQCCVTSPPYWGLRDYDCDGQLGLEATPEEFVSGLVKVFQELRRVLRDDGTVWLVIGDSFASGKGTCYNPGGGSSSLGKERKEAGVHPLDRGNKSTLEKSGLKPKDLVGIPWRVAFALQADGWWLRQDIIWAKPNPMPESVTDRCTKSHEYIFLLTKSARYYMDMDAIREPFNYPERTYSANTTNHKTAALAEQGNRSTAGLHDGRTQYGDPQAGRNRRSVWTIPTAPYKGAHFATFSPDLIRPCILAGTSEKGCCSKCGKPWIRVVEKSRTYESGSGKAGNKPEGKGTQDNQCDGTLEDDIRAGPCVQSKTIG
jgi:DNA modification methylase